MHNFLLILAHEVAVKVNTDKGVKDLSQLQSAGKNIRALIGHFCSLKTESAPAHKNFHHISLSAEGFLIESLDYTKALALVDHTDSNMPFATRLCKSLK